MKSPVVASRESNRTAFVVSKATAVTWATVAGCAVLLVGCASEPEHTAGNSSGRYFDAKLGVWASPRLVADGETVPRGGGGYLVGRPYVIGGQTYYPNPEPKGYSVVGTASWYGDAFHGRRTANGEIFDKGSITAAHPTLPLPSYVRVTNLKNNKSMIVRVNDRGPYHGGRVMDVSQRVAEALSFKGEGTARIRVDYIGRAGLTGSDDEKLMATLRDDGAPAQLGASAQLADASPAPDVSQPLSPPPVPGTPLRHQPILVAARVSHVSLSDPPPLFAPPSDPRPPPPLPLAAGRAPPAATKTAALAEAGARHPKANSSASAKAILKPVSGSRALARPTPPLRPLFSDPKPGNDAAAAAPEAH